MGRLACALFLSAVLAALALPALALAAAPDSTLTTVILVRHAEKRPHPPGGDSGLSVKGMERAQELARILKDAHVQAIYTSQYMRSRRTGFPLAALIADSVRVMDANHLDALVHRILTEHQGQTVLVIGHSDTVPQTIELLTGERLPDAEEISYDRIYVVTLVRNGPHRVTRMRYGAPG